MYRKFRIFLLFLAGQAHAEMQPVSSTPQVIVNGARTEVEASRDFVAGKLVIGRQRIQEAGVQSSGEVLAREPTISIGKDGRLGLLGLASYTQVLVDGMPYQGGDPFGIDVMRIDRIEIIKSSTAATGPVGIAGTINIILRKAERKASMKVSGGAASVDGRFAGDVSIASNQAIDDMALRYNWTLSARSTERPNESRYTQSRQVDDVERTPALTGIVAGLATTRIASANGELLWTVNADHKLSVSPEAVHLVVRDIRLEKRRQEDSGARSIGENSDSISNSLFLPVLWQWQIDPESTLALKLIKSVTRTLHDDEGADRTGDVAIQRFHRKHDTSTNSFFNLDYATALDSGHDITAGAKLARNDSAVRYADTVDGRADLSLAVFGNNSMTRQDRWQLFAQDEWRIGKSLALNVGMAFEQRHYDLDEGVFQNRARFNMWSPSLHLSQKINGDSKRVVRVSLARSYSPPFTDQLLLHPTINAFAPCVAGQLCGGNTVDTFDTAGNPGLKPERALGLNVSYDHGFGRSSEVRVEIYQRDIHNKIGYVFDLAAEPWASMPRYVLRPANLGQATVRGIDVEARLAGKDIAAFLVHGELHGSVGLARSTLSDLPGPNNHLAEQLPWRAKLGGSYTLQGWPVKLGFEASFAPSDWVRNNLTERVYQSSKAALGANASWSFSATSRMTANLDNLLNHRTSRIDAWEDGVSYLERVTRRTDHARFALRFETTL
jgi:outer membrane receptor for ferrienterochelin and colicins